MTRCQAIPDSKVDGANMGPIWGRQDPGGPHVGPMDFVIWDSYPAACPVECCSETDQRFIVLYIYNIVYGEVGYF